MLGVLDNPGNAAYAPRWRHDPAQSGGGVLMDMLHAVYVAEALLGRPGERASAWVSQRSPDTLVEELALCRFETAAAAAVVNVGWGVGPGGIDVSGTHGRLAIRYRGGGTGPFDPLDAVTVTSGEGEVWTVPTGERRFDGVEGILLDFAAAIAERRDPLASGEDGLHVLESVLAAYASARRGLAVSLPLDRDDPLFTNGILGLIREVA
jgi:predicted dehydrogenase